MHSCSSHNQSGNKLATIEKVNEQLLINNDVSRHLNLELAANLKKNISKISSINTDISRNDEEELSPKYIKFCYSNPRLASIARTVSTHHESINNEENRVHSLPTSFSILTKLSSTSVENKPRRCRLTKRRAMPPRSNSLPWKTETEQEINESDQKSPRYTASNENFFTSLVDSKSDPSKKMTYNLETNLLASYKFLEPHANIFKKNVNTEKRIKSAVANRILQFSQYKSNSLPSNDPNIDRNENIEDNVGLIKTISTETILLKDKKSQVLLMPSMHNNEMAETLSLSTKLDRTSDELSHLLNIILVEDDSDLVDTFR